jgi:3-hydroxy-9,10-secoandrosta-1,3,5(10)-triene-9,17-dione monooxygenase reductase component
MGLFASGVTIITGLDQGEPVGFTCQAFASVSLDPPLVLFCADHGGRSWPRIRNGGRFTVNVLDEGQAEMCARFGSRSGRKFEGLEWEASSLGTPALPGVLLCVHAEISAVHQAGDHDIVIGLVREVSCGDPGRPLVFYRGGFGLDPDAEALAHPMMAPGLWAWADHWG